VNPPPASSQRLPAAERRQALIDAALRVFSSRSYAGATTAEIAREAGVSEPILYRHFPSKRDLYLACLDATWVRLRETFDAKIAELGEENAAAAMGISLIGLRAQRVLPPNLWVQAITEAGEDPEIRRYLRKNMRDLHDFIQSALERAQEAGGMPRERDASAEAWVFIAGALLMSVGDRLGGLIDQEQLKRIAGQRHLWLTGRELRALPGR
jgi:AcrR family transcriptional regulator